MNGSRIFQYDFRDIPQPFFVFPKGYSKFVPKYDNASPKKQTQLQTIVCINTLLKFHFNNAMIGKVYVSWKLFY